MYNDLLVVFQRQFSNLPEKLMNLLGCIYRIISDYSTVDTVDNGKQYSKIISISQWFNDTGIEIKNLVKFLLKQTTLNSKPKQVSYSFSIGRLVELLHTFTIQLNEFEIILQECIDLFNFDFKPSMDKWIKVDIEFLELEHQLNEFNFQHGNLGHLNDARGLARHRLLKRKSERNHLLLLKNKKNKEKGEDILRCDDRIENYLRMKHKYKNEKEFLEDICHVYLYKRVDWEKLVSPLYIQRPYFKNDERFNTSKFMQYYYDNLHAIEVENKDVRYGEPSDLSNLSVYQFGKPTYGPIAEPIAESRWLNHTSRIGIVSENKPKLGTSFGGYRKSKKSKKSIVKPVVFEY
jgi:hypothetical protein